MIFLKRTVREVVCVWGGWGGSMEKAKNFRQYLGKGSTLFLQQLAAM